MEKLSEELGHTSSRPERGSSSTCPSDLSSARPVMRQHDGRASHVTSERSSNFSVKTSKEEKEEEEVDGGRLLRILEDENEKLSNTHLRTFLQAPWIKRFRKETRLAGLLKFKNRSKEITEAMAAVRQVRDAIRCLELSETGENVVMLDVCSGKGFTGLLLSLEFPRASVYLLDANGNMNLSHCLSQENLSFLHFDLFSNRAAQVLEEIAGSKTVIAVGIHLCGSLSPRLIDLFLFLPMAKALVLCPCCLRGHLGKSVKTAAKKSGRSYDETLCDVLAETLRNSSHVIDAMVAQDDQMLSPKCRFIVGLKPSNPGEGEEARSR